VDGGVLAFVVTAAVGALASLVIQGLLSSIISAYQSRGEFSGRWYAVSPATGKEPERRDKLRIRRRNHTLSIVANRYYPAEERGHAWRLSGYFHGNIIVMIFYTTTPRRNPSSFGVVVLRRDPAIRETSIWRGYYLRPAEHADGEAIRYPILWQRVPPEKKNYGTPEDVTTGSLPAGR
jgi:hypothetical protein